MDLTLNPDVDLEGAAELTLGKRVFKVPLLSFRQIRALIPLSKLVAGIKLNSLTEDQFDAIAKFVHNGLSAAYPNLTFDDFTGMQMTLAQLNEAIVVVTRQTGAPASAPTPGEQTAASA